MLNSCFSCPEGVPEPTEAPKAESATTSKGNTKATSTLDNAFSPTNLFQDNGAATLGLSARGMIGSIALPLLLVGLF